MKRYLCGSPINNCSGGMIKVSSGIGKKDNSTRGHTTREEAFRCFCKHLRTTGFTQIGAREFASPNNGPILLLNKKGSFGGELRSGKNEGTGKAKRFMPNVRTGGVIY